MDHRDAEEASASSGPLAELAASHALMFGRRLLRADTFLTEHPATASKLPLTNNYFINVVFGWFLQDDWTIALLCTLMFISCLICFTVVGIALACQDKRRFEREAAERDRRRDEKRKLIRQRSIDAKLSAARESGASSEHDWGNV